MPYRQTDTYWHHAFLTALSFDSDIHFAREGRRLFIALLAIITTWYRPFGKIIIVAENSEPVNGC